MNGLRTYRVHCPLRHDAIDAEGDDEGVFSPYTHDDVHASSPKAAAEDWVELHFADLDYTSCVEGLAVIAPDGTVTVWDVEVRSEPVFSASKARGEAR